MSLRLVGAMAASLVVSVAAVIAQPFQDNPPRRIVDPYREEHFSCVGQPDGAFITTPTSRVITASES